MTCIAWDGKVLAGDRRTTGENSGTIAKAKKVYRIQTRDRGLVLVGISGSLQDGVAFIEWLRGGARPEKVDSGMAALVIDARRNVWLVEDKLVFIPMLRGRHAVGSGKQPAIAAMMMGASARHAVWVASKIVCDVGDGVDTVSLR